MSVDLQGHLPSVELYQYSSEDVAGLNNKIPSLFAVQRSAKFHESLTKKEGQEVYLFVKNLSNEESGKVLNLPQTTNDHPEENEEEQYEEPDASNRNGSGESDYNSDMNESSILFILFIVIFTQLAHDVVTTLGFGCILVATSDNVVTTLSQRCVSDVITTTKN